MYRVIEAGEYPNPLVGDDLLGAIGTLAKVKVENGGPTWGRRLNWGEFDSMGKFTPVEDSSRFGESFMSPIWSANLLKYDPGSHRLAKSADGELTLKNSKGEDVRRIDPSQIHSVIDKNSHRTQVLRGGFVLPPLNVLRLRLGVEFYDQALELVLKARDGSGVFEDNNMVAIPQVELPEGTEVQLLLFSPWYRYSAMPVVIDPASRRGVRRQMVFPVADSDESRFNELRQAFY